MVIRVLNYGKVALNYEKGLARVKARVEVSCGTDLGKGYQDKVVVTPP